MKRNFQILVVVHQFLIFGSLVVQALTDSWMLPEMRSFLGIELSVVNDVAEVTAPSRMMDALWWGMTVLSLLASVGVILFQRWGRTLFVLVSILGLLLIPFGGIYIDVGWTVLVGSAATIIEGMIISLMFFSPLRKLFRSDTMEHSV
jgi:hypothetical protein